ncbi:MAG TPA: sugar-binding protein [Polyangiaceae bacterium]|jgi:hypothetical protein|nr:sugar-binding protein [Polyangiaceae bacterium]
MGRGRSDGLLRSRRASFVVVGALVIAACGRVGYEPLAGSESDQHHGSGGAAGRDASAPFDAASGSAGSGGALVVASGGGTTNAGAGDRSGASSDGGAVASGGVAGSGNGAGGNGAGGNGAGSGNVADARAPLVDAGLDARPDAPVVPPCAVAAVSDYCASVPALPRAPVLDGTADCNLALAPLPELGWTGGATLPDAHADYGVAWRPDGLYIFVHVHDPSLVPADRTREVWQGDALEMYIDSDGTYTAPPAYDDPGTRQLVAAAPDSAVSSVTRGAQYAAGHATVQGAWTSTSFRAFGKPDGYVVEAFIGAADLGLTTWTLAAGGTVGMSLSIDVSLPTDQGADAGGFGNRAGQYFLKLGDVSGASVIPPFDVRAFCNPTLVD